MRSYRVHACNADASGKIPYLVLSLCGANRVSIDMASMKEGPLQIDYTSALTMDALYQLLEGKSVDISRRSGELTLRPDGDQLVIEQTGLKVSHRVWMSELALAWNMLAGFGKIEGGALRFQ